MTKVLETALGVPNMKVNASLLWNLHYWVKVYSILGNGTVPGLLRKHVHLHSLAYMLGDLVLFGRLWSLQKVRPKLEKSQEVGLEV